MPRPKLDLFQKKPILFGQQCLLISIAGLTDIDEMWSRVSVLPHTGLIVNDDQLVNRHARLSLSPLLVMCPVEVSEWETMKQFRAWLRQVREYGACGVILTLPFGGEDELRVREEVKKLLAEVRKQALLGLISVQWSSVMQPNMALWAFAVRVGLDLKADHTLLQVPLTIQTKDIFFRSGGGNLIICSNEDWIDQQDEMPIYMRRMVAGGATGVCFLSAMLDHEDIEHIATQASEAVFGTGKLPAS